MSNFNSIPDDCIPVGVHSWTEKVCQTCVHCTWEAGMKCRQPRVLGLEHDVALERGISILTAYRLCRGTHWQEQEFEE